MENGKADKEDKFRHVFEESAAPLVILQSNGYIYEMNRAARALFSFSPDDRPLYSSVYIKPGLPRGARKAMERLDPFYFEGVVDFDKLRSALPFAPGTGGAVELKVRMTPVNQHNGNDGPLADYLLELTPKGGDAAAGPDGADFMLNHDAVLLCSGDGVIMRVNAAAARLLAPQQEEDQLKGKSVYSFFDADAAAELKEAALRLPAPKSLIEREFTVSAGKNTFPAQVMLAPAAGGAFALSLRNMTARRQLDTLLKERSERLASLEKVIDGALLECDVKESLFQNFAAANAKALGLTGLTRKAVMSMSLTDALTDKDGKERKKVLAFLAGKAKQLREGETVSFEARLRFGDREVFASVRITAYDFAGRQRALIIVRDNSKERILESELDYKLKELAGIKNALPGLYLKAGRDGVIQEYKTADLRYNIAVFPGDFVGKNPLDYLDKQTVEQYLEAVSEVIRTGVPFHGSFSVKYGVETRFYEAAISQIKGEDNVIVMVNLVDNRKGLENKIKDLYAISANRGGGFVNNMDDILEYGKKIFSADAGLILHFSGVDREKILVKYATRNDYQINKGLETPVDACYAEVREGKIFSVEDAKTLPCKEGCLHTLKGITSMLSAPLIIGGRVEGAITFLSLPPNQMLITEEDRNFMGFIGGLMGMALELRSAKKAVDAGLSTLKKLISSLDTPAFITDTSFRIKNANVLMLQICGAHDIVDVEDKNIFARFASDEVKAQTDFNSAYKICKGGLFDTDFDLVLADSKVQNIIWHVVEIKDSRGRVRGFLFVSEGVRDMPAVRNLLGGPQSHV
ncbi:MAG: PAS domain-containing protein [Elusimicrobiota bacterium]|jgi:PAS domain-containing protein|nr:PAS domain-containing protein [Elusimicrobiota bacterium]